jgi:hypothetical protein
MAIFNSKLLNYQRVFAFLFLGFTCAYPQFPVVKAISDSPVVLTCQSPTFYFKNTKFRIDISYESPNKIASTTPILSNITKIALPKNPQLQTCSKKHNTLENTLEYN